MNRRLFFTRTRILYRLSNVIGRAWPRCLVESLNPGMLQYVKKKAVLIDIHATDITIHYDRNEDFKTWINLKVFFLWIIYLLQIQRALLKDVGALFTVDESTSEGQLFGLSNLELTTIKPNYEAMIKNGHLRATEMGLQHVGMCFFQWS